jgi:hypothetical protein
MVARLRGAARKGVVLARFPIRRLIGSQPNGPTLNLVDFIALTQLNVEGYNQVLSRNRLSDKGEGRVCITCIAIIGVAKYYLGF